MKLLLDVGNTAVKWACLENGRQGMSGYFVHRAGSIEVLANAAWSGLPAADEVLVANVAGRDIEAELSEWFAVHWEVKPVFLRSVARACGVTNAYRDPESLGIDRWAAVVAAHHDYPGNVCVVDCGTAITLDMVTANGEHRGGLILPGIEIMQQMLSQNTALLRLSGKQQAATPLADGTAAGIYSGAVYMVVAAIDRCVTDMCAELGGSIDIIVTGGDAGRVLSLLQGDTHHVADLVLRGIATLAGGDG
jgi:type III pantothenate kinase